MEKIEALKNAVKSLKLASHDSDIRHLIADLENKIDRLETLEDDSNFPNGTVFSY